PTLATFSDYECWPGAGCGRRSGPEVEIVGLAREALRDAGRGSRAAVGQLRPGNDGRTGVELRLAPTAVAEHVELSKLPTRRRIDRIVTHGGVSIEPTGDGDAISAGVNRAGQDELAELRDRVERHVRDRAAIPPAIDGGGSGKREFFPTRA